MSASEAGAAGHCFSAKMRSFTKALAAHENHRAKKKILFVAVNFLDFIEESVAFSICTAVRSENF